MRVYKMNSLQKDHNCKKPFEGLQESSNASGVSFQDLLQGWILLSIEIQSNCSYACSIGIFSSFNFIYGGL